MNQNRFLCERPSMKASCWNLFSEGARQQAQKFWVKTFLKKVYKNKANSLCSEMDEAAKSQLPVLLFANWGPPVWGLNDFDKSAATFYSTLLTIQCLLWISFWRNDSSEMVSMRSFCYLQRTLGTSKLEAADLRWFFQAFERLIDGYWWVRWIMSGWWMPSRNANCLAESVANKRRAKLITNSIIESAGKCLRISRFVGSDESDQTKIYSLLGIYARQRPTKTTKEDSGTEI